MQKALSLIPYRIFPAKLGGQKGIALFNEYFSKVFPLCSVTVKSTDPKYASYPVYNILGDSAFRYVNPVNFFRLRKVIRQEKVTHLILEHPYFGWLGILLKQVTGVKLVVHSHNIESTRWKTLGKWWWKVLRWYEGIVHRKADYSFFIHDNDRRFAIREYRIFPSKAVTITYGIDIKEPPSSISRAKSRQTLIKRYNLDASTTIMLFNGSLNYSPNLNAVKNILEFINPLLIDKGVNYKIIICGSGLPAEMQELQAYREQHIIYAGFVDDISLYFKGADIFLNPVIEGGGIKTKLVEALGYGTKSVSTQNGSIGVRVEECGELLGIVADRDWQAFTEEIIKRSGQPVSEIPAAFFRKFYWGDIAIRAAEFISA